MKKEKYESMLFWFTVLTAIIIFIIVLAEIYVRWKLNQSFTFLGGFELEALTLLLLGELVLLSRSNHER